jgi:uncharacterized membrane protein YfcA
VSAPALAALSAAAAVVALLYSSVGHAGASGYIAVMALFGLEPAVIKPTALVLNILVAAIATRQFRRAGYFDPALFWPFALAAVPFAFLGGYLTVPAAVFKKLVGLVLWFSAARLAFSPRAAEGRRRPSIAASVLIGAGLGLLSGMTGTGGGIFLTPLLLLMGWADAKQAAGVSAPFILLNSAAGLSGNVLSTARLPLVALPLAAAAVAGGIVGSTVGANRLSVRQVQACLAVVLAVAGAKLVLF